MKFLDRLLRVGLPLTVIAVVLTLITVAWMTEPDRYVQGFAPTQPLPFSHKIHAGDNNIPCEYCHTSVRTSRHAGIPAVDACFKCHNVTRLDSPFIQQLTELRDSGKPLEWKRIHSLPDYVYFDHRPHVAKGIACQECHGPVETMETVSQVLKMRMGACLECHRGERTYTTMAPPYPTAPVSCGTCHR